LAINSPPDPSLEKRGGRYNENITQNTNILKYTLRDGIIIATIYNVFCSPTLGKRKGWGMSL
jgi:hypothetical protein